MTDSKASIEARVGKVETALESLHEDVASLKGDLRVISGNLNAGLENIRRDASKAFEDMRREVAAGKQTNWGWVAAFIGVSLGLVGYFASTLVSPLATFDRQIESRVDRLQALEMQTFERAIRSEERLAAMKEHAKETRP